MTLAKARVVHFTTALCAEGIVFPDPDDAVPPGFLAASWNRHRKKSLFQSCQLVLLYLFKESVLDC